MGTGTHVLELPTSRLVPAKLLQTGGSREEVNMTQFCHGSILGHNGPMKPGVKFVTNERDLDILPCFAISVNDIYKVCIIFVESCSWRNVEKVEWIRNIAGEEWTCWIKTRYSAESQV